MNFVLLLILQLTLRGQPGELIKDTLKTDTVKSASSPETSKRKAWIWYKPYAEAKLDTTTIEKETLKVATAYIGDSSKPVKKDTVNPSFFIRVFGIPDTIIISEDELPIDPNTPAPIRRLLLNPTVENAEKVIAWLMKLQERSIKVSNAMLIASMKLGLENPYSAREDYYLTTKAEMYIDSVASSTVRRGVLVAYLGKNYMSNLMIPEIRKLAQIGFPVLVVSKEDIRDILPDEPNIKFVKMDQIPEIEAINIKFPPAVLFVYPERRSVYLIARKPVFFREMLDRVMQMEAGLWMPVLVY